MKNVLKELIIVLLLCLAIILLLGIILYEYVPISKTVPNKVEYKTSEEIKEELQDAQGVNEEEVIMTYKIDSNDLNNYKRVESYKPGKANPFSSYEVSGSTSGGYNSATGEQGGNANTGSTNQNTTSGGGTFFQDKGTK